MDSVHRFLQVYQEGWNVLWNPQHEPKHSAPYYFRDQMKAMVLYTNSEERSLPYRSLWHTFALIQLSIIFTSMCYAVTESLGDIEEMGRDLAFILGYFFIIFKLFYFHWHADGVDEVVHDLEACRQWLREGPGSAEARTTRRFHYMFVILMLTAWSLFMGIFIVLIITSPLWVAQQNLPLHVKYPLELHSKSKHPLTHALCYLSQALAIPYSLIWLMAIEGLSVSIYWEITCTIKMLCIEFRHLNERCHGDEKLLKRSVKRVVGYHHKILSILDRTNEVFYGTLKMQALLARKDLKVAFQFGVLMLLALGHLSLWSKFGDLMSQESLDIAQAAYEAYDPSLGCSRVNRDLCFIIKRAQIPMQMRASPFPPFNLINYSAILHQCYSILTLLLNTLD